MVRKGFLPPTPIFLSPSIKHWSSSLVQFLFSLYDSFFPSQQGFWVFFLVEAFFLYILL